MECPRAIKAFALSRWSSVKGLTIDFLLYVLKKIKTIEIQLSVNICKKWGKGPRGRLPHDVCGRLPHFHIRKSKGRSPHRVQINEEHWLEIESRRLFLSFDLKISAKFVKKMHKVYELMDQNITSEMDKMILPHYCRLRSTIKTDLSS